MKFFDWIEKEIRTINIQQGYFHLAITFKDV